MKNCKGPDTQCNIAFNFVEVEWDSTAAILHTTNFGVDTQCCTVYLGLKFYKIVHYLGGVHYLGIE